MLGAWRRWRRRRVLRQGRLDARLLLKLPLRLQLLGQLLGSGSRCHAQLFSQKKGKFLVDG